MTSPDSITMIKEELERINEARAKALKGQYEYDDGRGIRENACGWLEYESFAANKIDPITKALSVAVSFIDSCTPNENGDMCQEHLGDVANDAYYAAKKIAEILARASASGGGEIK